ncbi:NmrA domain-containing protein [Favolaschia claudopus]|uniref:NmrA domain-containing protein n=1 Tax=Favolaschia claudopus TaxID=2862362 RepID=A0AAW0CBY2_9AGAR
MSPSRIVSVFGATGVQGSAVIDRLLKDGSFLPRAITRNPDSEAAAKLKSQGIEIAKGDAGDKASLVDALRGSEVVFMMTLPVVPEFGGKGPGEVAQGKNIIDAAKEVGVKFIVFTSLPDVSKLSGGKYADNIPVHSDKQIVQEYLKSSGIDYTVFYLGGFLENFLSPPGPRNFMRKTDTGYNIVVPLYSPESLATFTWIQRDLAESTLAVLKNYTDSSKSITGKAYPLVTANILYPALADIFAKGLGVEVKFTTGPPSGISVLDNMFAVRSENDGLPEFKENAVPNPSLVALGAKLGTVEEFVETELKKR